MRSPSEITLNLPIPDEKVWESFQEVREIGLGYLKEKKIIEGEAVGLLEAMESEHDLTAAEQLGSDEAARHRVGAKKGL
jgi:hypothetical protein